jgi:hypothetical protein
VPALTPNHAHPSVPMRSHSALCGGERDCSWVHVSVNNAAPASVWAMVKNASLIGTENNQLCQVIRTGTACGGGGTAVV